ncbi:MAG: type II toxin-antitoxin system RelE/ParE family toxin [Oscillospiraceae bacterium]|jgi:mRNA interferase RelE/StbE|nr:type II toxin-antitoxin system RelE/ParE family toxin [Oscillospiraceae bacterium]
MTYKVVIEKKARKFIKSQPAFQQRRLHKAIGNLPSGGDIKYLSGNKEAFRLRVGNYRVIFTKDNDVYIVTVVDIDNRGQIYKSI